MATHTISANTYTGPHGLDATGYLINGNQLINSVRPNSEVVRFVYDSGYVQNVGIGAGGEQNPSERPTTGFLFPRN